MADNKPDILIEKWLPIQEIGIESQRENSTGQHPPLNRLHVWWARRPLTASAAAVLASLLPRWRDDWPKRLQKVFPNESTYRRWFLRLLGITGDPIAGRNLIQYAKQKNIKLKTNPYGYPRAFTTNPGDDDLEVMLDLLEFNWGTRDLTVCDPMAGGGSIPFEALRYGFTTYANELNPVASVILKSTLDYPARYGEELAADIQKYGKLWAKKVEKLLKPYFPRDDDENIFAYLWARTVACPTTGKPVPLSPNWWLQKGNKPMGVELIVNPRAKACSFDIVRGVTACKRAKPDEGTVKRGVGRSPWTGEAIDGDYIKAEAQAGRMGQQLYAIGVKRPGGFDFRPPTNRDLKAIKAAEEELTRRLPEWEAKGLVPDEDIPDGNKTSEPRRYGMYRWADVFAPRQLLALCTFIETLHEITAQIERDLPPDRAKAVVTYLGLAFDKCCDYNSRIVKWDGTRNKICNTFDRHDFSFKWSFAEFDASRNLLPWTQSQVIDAFSGIAKLASPVSSPLFCPHGKPLLLDRLNIENNNAISLSTVKNRSCHIICVDPPYYDNVMYAECSDFFYVWMKRTQGKLHPEFFTAELTNKDEEAVANVARFADMGRKKRELAETDYERKMAACFREMHRILTDDGVLTVMFTHKRVEAWNTLGTALIGAGFAVQSSWPVHTESEHSLHQAKKNAAASTILLTCRKREQEGEPVWWDDLKSTVRSTAREKAAEFQGQGISGVDLYISTFGPVLSIISAHWPVLTSEVDEQTGNPKPLKPEAALEIAREEVIRLRKQGLLMGRTVQFDPVTDWYLMAWDAFKAEEFPFDEARKLALALNLDMEQDLVKAKRVIGKKQNFVVVNTPRQRRHKHLVDTDRIAFDCQLDAVHTVMLVYDEDGTAACSRFLRESGLMQDSRFKACLQAMINAIPRTQDKGTFVRDEAATLDNLRLNFFEDLTVPVEEEPEVPVIQMHAFDEEDNQ